MGYMDAHATYKLLPDGAESDEVLEHFQAAYVKADAQSLAAARQYRRILAALAAAGTVCWVEDQRSYHKHAELCSRVARRGRTE